jgi:hypothetical protein
LALASYAFVSIIEQSQFIARAEKIDSKVIRIETFQKNSKSYKAQVFEYKKNGEIFKVPFYPSSIAREYNIGEKAELLVDPKNPQHFYPSDFLSLWIRPLLLGLVSLIIVFGSAFAFTWRKKYNKGRS